MLKRHFGWYVFNLINKIQFFSFKVMNILLLLEVVIARCFCMLLLRKSAVINSYID